MSDIKAVGGLKKSEVMRRAEEGERVAYTINAIGGEQPLTEIDGELLQPNWQTYTYYIIDTATPSIELDKVDWDFFIQYGGLPLLFEGEPMGENQEWSNTSDVTVTESPFYYWPGGEQPLPDNVEVEVEWLLQIHSQRKTFERKRMTRAAFNLDWKSDSIVGFKLTGKVLGGAL